MLEELRKEFNSKSVITLLRYNDELKTELIEKTNFLPNIVSISERLYCWYHNINELQTCPHCGQPRKFHRFTYGYFPTCGNKECKSKSVSYANKFNHDYVEIKKKMKETYASRHNGIEHNMKDPEFKKTFFKKFKEKHNGISCGVRTEKAIENAKQSSIKKYGVECCLSDKNVRDKIYEKYGDNARYIINRKSGITRKKNDYNEILGKISEMNMNFISYDKISGIFTLECKNCGHINTYSRQSVNYYYRNYKHLTCCKCEYKGFTFRSNFEKEVLNNIQELLKNTKYSVLSNKHFYIDKLQYEVDIFIPELKICIECNGLYWHSELQKSDNFYHYNKKVFIEKLGYKLIYIWEDEWNDLDKRNIILSRLCSKFNLNKKIYARKCTIKKLTSHEYNKFCSEYHLQGSVNASIKLGLFYNNELVQCIGLGKSRKNIGNNDGYELIRLCSKNYVNVIGGFSKLMKYARTLIEGDIYSYADLSWIDLNGTSYINTGFELIDIIKQEYWWVVENIRRNRLDFTKHKLVNQGYDSSLTEIEIMHQLKNYRVFGPGNLKLKYIK